MINLKIYVLTTLAINSLTFGLQAQANSESEPLKIKVEKVVSSPIQPAITGVGYVFGIDRFKITAGFSASIEWLVEMGQAVNKGDILAKLDRQSTLIEKQELLGIVEREKVKFNYYKNELARFASIEKKRFISAEEVERMHFNLAIAETEIKIAQTQLQKIIERLSRAQVVSPFNGVVIESYGNIGEQTTQASVLGLVQDTENLKLKVLIPLRYSTDVQVGSPVKIKLMTAGGSNNQNDSDVYFYSQVTAILPNTDAKSQSFEVHVALPSANNQNWQIGQLLQAQIIATEHTDNIAVSRDAVVSRSSGDYVFKITPEQTTEKVSVTLGSAKDRWVEVKGKLNVGDTIAVSGVERLEAKQKVKVVL